jgi:hypothetical protein
MAFDLLKYDNLTLKCYLFYKISMLKFTTPWSVAWTKGEQRFVSNCYVQCWGIEIC